jgi:hypothetical protein
LAIDSPSFSSDQAGKTGCPIFIYKQMSQFQNVPLWPISALGSNFNPQNTQCILPVEMFARLDLDQTETF